MDKNCIALALEAVQKARCRVGETLPHKNDYKSKKEYEEAQQKHENRMEKLREIWVELCQISNQF